MHPENTARQLNMYHGRDSQSVATKKKLREIEKSAFDAIDFLLHEK